MAAASEASAKGIKAYETGNYIEAIGHFTEAIKHEPKGASHYVNRAIMYYLQHEYSNALKDAKKAVNMMPPEKDPCLAYTCMTFAYIGLKQYKNALSANEKCLEVDPDNVYLKFSFALAESLMNDQQAELAEEEEEEALDATTIKQLISKQNALITKQNAVQQRVFELLESSCHPAPFKLVDDDFSVKTALGVLKRMVDDGGLIAKGSELWCVATDLFEDARKIELFICMPDDEGRIAWLKHNTRNNITKNKNMINGPDGAPIEEKKDLVVNVGGAPEEKKEELKEASDKDDTGFCLISI